MARRRRTIYKRRRKRPPDRPLKLRTRRLYKPERIDDEIIVHVRGPRRTRPGIDPLEARAVPKEKVRGSLPERIFYKSLLQRKYRPDRDFDFQSSLQGGRQELGGIVADFIFVWRRLIVRIQSLRWHSGFAEEQRDDEQRAILQELGFGVLDLWDYTIYDERELEY